MQARSVVSDSRPPCSSIRSARNCESVSMALVLMKYALSFLRESSLIDDPQLINRIRHSATLVATLPPETQRAARDSYAVALRAVFTMAAISTAVAFVVRLPVSSPLSLRCRSFDTHARAPFARFPRKHSIINRSKNLSRTQQNQNQH